MHGIQAGNVVAQVLRRKWHKLSMQ